MVVCQKAIWDKPEMTLKFCLNGNQDAADRPVWEAARHVVAVDVKTITTPVSSIAPNSYRGVCGPCVTSGGNIFSDVMFFQ